MKRGTDWLAWSLQFIVGLFVGALTGFGIISKGRRFDDVWLLAAEQVSTFIWGAALIGAGLASFYGDRLWLGSSYQVIPPDDIAHSNASRIISVAMAVSGGILVLIAILRHFRVF